MGSINTLRDVLDSVEFADSVDSIDSIRVPRKRPPTLPQHTKSGARATDGSGAFGAAPISVVVFSLCILRIMAVFWVARVENQKNPQNQNHLYNL